MNTDAAIRQAVTEVLATTRVGRGSRPLVPGAAVADRYQNGEPRTYLVDGRTLTYSQYRKLRDRLGLRRGRR